MVGTCHHTWVHTHRLYSAGSDSQHKPRTLGEDDMSVCSLWWGMSMAQAAGLPGSIAVHLKLL